MTAKEVVKKALAEVGTTEYPPSSNNVIYNRLFYGKSVYGQNYPWCCAFVWWLLSTSGVKCPKTASCINMATYFKNENRWYKEPQVGDLVFFKFKTNARWTNHVGIVVDVKGNEITTVEGNTSINSDDNGGAVMKRKRSSNIVGYGRPKYDIESVDPVEEVSVRPILKRGSKGQFVRAWQTYLTTCNINVGEIDGIFGKLTEAGVKQYQKKMNLPVTGVIDADDWNSVGQYK